MPVTRKAKAAPEPARTPASVRAPAANRPTQPFVQLVNNASTYVTPQREIFYARDQLGKIRVYPVNAKDLPRLLSYKDDFGRSFFREVNPTEIQKQNAAAEAKHTAEMAALESGRGPAGTIEEVTGDGVGGKEIDTAEGVDVDADASKGVTRLEDDDGEEVGVKV